MESRNMVLLLLAIAIVSAFLVPSITATDQDESWDLAIARGSKIHFLKNDTEIWNSTVANISAITALAYNSANRTVYMSAWSDERYVSSLLYSDDSVAENLNPRPVLNPDRPDSLTEIIPSMVFDPVRSTLFWIDYNNSRLMKMKVTSEGSDTVPQMLHDLKGKVPASIALDVWNRFIYWVTSDSVERSRLDGADREAIITGGSFDDYGSSLAIDSCGGKLYFTNTYPRFSLIEETNLDGTNRRVVVNNTYTIRPNSLAVDGTTVYWADRVTRSLSKAYKNGTVKREIRFDAYKDTSRYLMNIITRYSAGDGNCKAL